jgi:phosphatidylserine/phosphatidylglycerophosphate/cardiolipin synthase-like enzyme
MERVLCPRVHLKAVIVDGSFAYSGSANLTGAGMGAKSEHKRNFESGIITDDSEIIAGIMEQFDSIWRGNHCSGCGRKRFCADYKDILTERRPF